MGETQEQKSRKLFLVGVGLILGCLLTVGAGFGMKMSDQRPFCSKCHIMNQAAITHKMSAHAKLACNDCHAPHDFISKLPFKAVAGTKDMYLNMFGKLQEPISAGLDTKRIVNANCKICHTMTNVEVASMDVKGVCTDCHRNVQHMRMKPISTRSVGDV